MRSESEDQPGGQRRGRRKRTSARKGAGCVPACAFGQPFTPEGARLSYRRCRICDQVVLSPPGA